MSGTILLPLVIFTIATVALVMAWQSIPHKTGTRGYMEKAVLVICYLIVISICYKYSSMSQAISESFEVNIPDPQEIIDEEMTKAINNKSLHPENKTPDASGPITFSNPDEIHNYANKSGDNIPNTGTTTPPNDKFADVIEQKDTNGTSSLFNPQIIINGAEVAVVPKMTGHGSSYTPGPASFMDIDSDNVVAGNNYMGKSPSNLKPNSIEEYLQPKGELFDNTDGVSTSDDAFKWMETYLRNNPNNGSGGKLPAACSFSKPYAEERSKSKVDPMTLNDKTYVPGMSYMPPKEWAVPQYRHSSCRSVCPVSQLNTRELPIGIMDPGTPIFALEIGSDGDIAKSEDEVTLTNVGSICPKFEYREYIDCPSGTYPQQTKYIVKSTPQATSPMTTTRPTTTFPTTTNPTTTRPTTTSPMTTRPTTTFPTTTNPTTTFPTTTFPTTTRPTTTSPTTTNPTTTFPTTTRPTTTSPTTTFKQ